MWQYTDDTHTSVHRTDERGNYESRKVEAIADWLAMGNVPEPYVAPPQPLVTVLEPFVFRDRFTQAELIAINSLAYSGNSIAQLLLLKVATATAGIDITSQSVIDGLTYLVTQGVLTDVRATEILAP